MICGRLYFVTATIILR